MLNIYIEAHSSFFLDGGYMNKKWVISLSIFLLLSLSLITLRADPASLVSLNENSENNQLVTAQSTSLEETPELSSQEREQQINSYEITLGISANLSDSAVIEVNSKGQSLTKTDYILCRKLRMKIDAKILEKSEVDEILQEKCIDILNFQDPDYIAIKKAQDAEENKKVEEYYASYKNFNDLDFEEVETQEITKEAKEHDIVGYILDDKEYVVDIVTCEEDHNGCYLKINGGNTGLLQIGNFYTFGENKGYNLELTSIQYNVCGKRFCDYGYDTYNLVSDKLLERNVK